MSSEEQEEFVKVVGDESCEVVELPLECNDTLLLATLQGQFPDAVCLRYQTSSGSWRGVRMSNDALNPPHGGWDCDTTYHVTTNKGLKRKTDPPPGDEEESSKKSLTHIDESPKISLTHTDEESKKSSTHMDEESKRKDKRCEKRLLKDLIVLGLPMKCMNKDLKEYFTAACGEMSMHQVKSHPRTKKSKGFGFIRFKTADGAKAALTGQHSIMGKTIKIRMSKTKDEPLKLFVGRIPEETSAEELKDYFEEFGEIQDTYIPQPARGFGFVTFASSEDGHAALKITHKIGDTRLNVQYPEQKEEKISRRREKEGAFMKGGRRASHENHFNGIDPRNRDIRDRRDMRDTRRNMMDNRRSRDNDCRGDNDEQVSQQVSQLKGLLHSILSRR